MTIHSLLRHVGVDVPEVIHVNGREVREEPPMKRRDPLLGPQPKWRQRRAALVAWWRKTRDARHKALKTFRTQARKLLTLAVSVLGATLISFGVWTVHPSAGYIVAGLLLWGVQWNYAKEEGDG